MNARQTLGKQTNLAFLGSSPDFLFFSIHSVFFPFPFLFRGFKFLQFRFLWPGAFPRKPCPGTGLIFSSHPPPPRPTITQRDRQARCKTQACRVVVAPCSPQTDTHVLCASQEVKRCSGQKTEGLKAAQHARHARTTTEGL